MTEKQAYQEGLAFTGIYECLYNKDVVKERAAEIRKKYNCKAVMVKESTGYSVYADKKYFDLHFLEYNERKLSHIDERKEYLLKKYLKELAEIENEEETLKSKIKETKEKYSL